MDIYLFSHLHPIVPPSVTVWRRFASLNCNRFSPPTLSGTEQPSTLTSPPHDSFHGSSLRFPPLMSSTCCLCPSWTLGSCAECLCLMCPSFVCPPFSALDMRPGPCHILRVLPYMGPSLPLPSSVSIPSATLSAGLNLRLSPWGSQGVFDVLCCVPCPFISCASASTSLRVTSSLGLLWWLVSLQVSFCVIARVQGASTYWKSLAQALSPTLLGHAGNIKAIQSTRPFSSPPCPCDTIPVYLGICICVYQSDISYDISLALPHMTHLEISVEARCLLQYGVDAEVWLSHSCYVLTWGD